MQMIAIHVICALSRPCARLLLCHSVMAHCCTKSELLQFKAACEPLEVLTAPDRFTYRSVPSQVYTIWCT